MCANARLLLLMVLALVPGSALGKPRPTSKIDVFTPEAGASLSGVFEVRLKITPLKGKPAPASVHCGLGGVPWTAMERVGDSGEWVGKIDSTMVPNGRQNIIIQTEERRGWAFVEVSVKNPLKVFFGDLHSHTGYSDGALLPSVAHKYARDTAKLDVFVLTDHLEQVDDREWSDMRELACDYNEDGKFVCLSGLEWTKDLGHSCIYDPKVRNWPVERLAFYDAIAEAGVIAKFNHPDRGENVFDGLAYSESGDKAIQLMEVRRPEEEEAFIRALNNGWHIGPDGSDDTHEPNWGNCGNWTGILAPGLSKRCIWDALKNRRVYSTHDRNCELVFQINGADMGAIVAGLTTEARVSVSVDDPDSSDLIAKIELFEDGKIVETNEPGTASAKWETTLSPTPGGHYYFAKVTQADGNQLWSAPIWVNEEIEPGDASPDVGK